MPKAKSPTVKRSEKIEAEKLQRVSQWTKNELTNLQKNSKLPICIELQNGDYLVGTQKVEKISPVCWKVGEVEFSEKRSAVFYCALTHLKQFKEARELRDMDWRVGKLDSDKAVFRIRLDNAHSANDQFKIDLYSSRFDDTKRRLAQAKQELEKIISQAKYLHGII